MRTKCCWWEQHFFGLIILRTQNLLRTANIMYIQTETRMLCIYLKQLLLYSNLSVIQILSKGLALLQSGVLSTLLSFAHTGFFVRLLHKTSIVYIFYCKLYLKLLIAQTNFPFLVANSNCKHTFYLNFKIWGGANWQEYKNWRMAQN